MTTRTVEERLAVLEAEVADIMLTTAETAGVRSAVYDRAATLTFSSDQISAMSSLPRITVTSE